MKVHYLRDSEYSAPVIKRFVLNVDCDILSASQTGGALSNKDMTVDDLNEDWI